MVVLILVPLGVAAAPDAPPAKTNSYYEPLPQDTGKNGLELMLRRLNTTGRLMQIDAHPDDEDGGMLTLEARGKGESTLLMTLNRGEGGQNKLGSNLFDVLGVVRTLEVLAADRYYGVEQRFSRVADFGYSKTPEETFQKWGGHDIALADIVRVVRTFKPDVLIARFSGTERDGHGHHQASAILTKEAFRAAADPNRFPEQIKEGLQPWQPKKLYIGNVCGFGASTCDPANYTVKLNTGKEDPLLGMSYVQFAVEGLVHQESQGLAGIKIPKGDRFAYYKLVDSVIDSPKDKDGHEQDFFDGIDTTLVGLASRLGDEEKKVPWLREELTRVQQDVTESQQNAEIGSQKAAEALLEARAAAEDLVNKVKQSSLSEGPKLWLATELQSKQGQLEHAANLVLGLSLKAAVPEKQLSSPESTSMAVPGEPVAVEANIRNGELPINLLSAALVVNAPACKSAEGRGAMHEALAKASVENVAFETRICANAGYSRPYWHRHDPERDSLNTIDEPQYQTLPLPPPPFHVVMKYEYQALHGSIEVPVMVRFRWPDGSEGERPLAIGPEFSLALTPSTDVIPSDKRGSTNVTSTARDQSSGSEARIALKVPEGWRAEPPRESVNIPKDKAKDVSFQVFPSELQESQTHISAELTSGKKTYTEGYTVVTREDLGTFYYYQPALQRVSIVNVKVPKDRKIGYIMGAGDDIATVLQQIGMNVTMIPADKLASEDLSQYPTIVLGIRAYEQKDIVDNNKRLIDYVENGGRLVVQYNTMGSFASPINFNAGKYTPYPATLSHARVSVEEAPVKILDPANPVFHYPNEITEKDFDGWVQERGLYFMSQWDPKYTPLLETHDPGEPEQKGGLLVAQYGKGTYIYTGLSFFRQLPAGVPGAVRLFVNLLSSSR